MNVLVLGHGSMGKRHAANAIALGHAITVYDPAVPELSHLADDTRAFDAVIIATPAHLHVDQIARALGNQQHVFCEKPLALSVADTAHACLTWDATVTTQVGYNLRFHPAVQQLKRDLATIGRIRSADLWLRCDMRSWPGTAYASPLLECSHELDLARCLFGELTVDAAQQIDPHALELTLRTADWKPIRISLVTDAGDYQRGVRVVGKDATATYDWHAPSGRTTYRFYDGSPGGNALTTTVMADDTYRAEVAYFLTCCAAGISATPDFSDGIATLKLCDRIQDIL